MAEPLGTFAEELERLERVARAADGDHLSVESTLRETGNGRKDLPVLWENLYRSSADLAVARERARLAMLREIETGRIFGGHTICVKCGGIVLPLTVHVCGPMLAQGGTPICAGCKQAITSFPHECPHVESGG